MKKLPLTGSWQIRRLGVFPKFFKWGYLFIGWVLNYEEVKFLCSQANISLRLLIIIVTVRVFVTDYFVLWDLEWLGAT